MDEASLCKPARPDRSAPLSEPRLGIDFLPAGGGRFEMQVWTGRVAAVPYLRDLITHADTLPDGHRIAVVVPVGGDRSIIVSNPYPQPEALRGAGTDDRSIGRSHDRGPHRVGDVDTAVLRTAASAEV